VPAFPQQPVDERYERLITLVHRCKAAARKGEDLSYEESVELARLLNKHKDKYPKERLREWHERQQNAEAIGALAAAARTVMLAYAGYMPGEFVAALRDQFVDRTAEDEAPCTCFVWHKTAAEWSSRLIGFGGQLPNGPVDGMTPFWDGALAHSSPALLAGNYPPLNRSIEFPEPKFGTLVHEMIHWCTSPEFHGYSLRLVGNERVLVREGATEWLKRNAMKDWESGGYTDVMPRFRKIIDSRKVDPEQLMAAYFGGRDAESILRRIVEADRQFVEETMQAVGDEFEKSERERLTPMIKKPAFSLNRSPEFRGIVFKAFGRIDETALRAQVQNAAWVKYLLLRKAGSSDADAYTEAKK
jgi:hypothetical protein